MSLEQKQKEETLKKHLMSLYRTEKEVGVLTSLCQEARWFVKERREERFVRMLYGEFTRARKLKSGMLLRTLMLVDRLLRLFRSFRQHIATVIVQIFVELFSIFFESDSFAEVIQLKKLRKRWVTLLPDECLLKIKSTIKKRFEFDVDSGFSEAIIQELKDFYVKDLKLTPEQCQKYLPKVKTREQNSRRSVEPEPQSDSPDFEERFEKRQREEYSKAPAVTTSQPKQPSYPVAVPAMTPQNPHYDPYAQQRHMAPQAFPQRLPPGYPPQHYYYPQGIPHNPTMAMNPGGPYMQYPQQTMGYHPAYYPPGQYQMMDPYYQKMQPQIPAYHPDYYQKPYEDRNATIPHQQPIADYEIRREQDRERERERTISQPKPIITSTPPPAIIEQHYNNGRSNPQQSQQSSLSAREKLQELRLGSLRCPRCGLQSAQRESFDLHLKSHFQQSRRAYEIVRKNGPTQRAHLPDTQQWLEASSEEDERDYFVEMGLARDVLSELTQKLCRLCAGQFKPSWDAKLQKWVYRGVVSVTTQGGEGTFHYDCFKALQSQQPRNN